MKHKVAAPLEPRADVGIIVGRYQIHELHEAHIDMIDFVCEEHDKVIIFIGLSPLRGSMDNPLDFNSRKVMIQETYPDIEVYYVEDNRDDNMWSANLDNQITKWLTPHQTPILYGGRDSFIPHYTGRFPTKELSSTKIISGTEIRRRISNNFKPTVGFRAGVIAAAMNRYPTCYATVDVAIMDSSARVLLGKKPGEKKLRFVGGFSSPTSPSYEVDAKREAAEETSVEIDNVQYIGSTLIDDWRYRKSIDKIKTLFFVAQYIHGTPQAGDDIEYLEWVSLSDLLEGKVPMMPEHDVLVTMLSNTVANPTNKFQVR